MVGPIGDEYGEQAKHMLEKGEWVGGCAGGWVGRCVCGWVSDGGIGHRCHPHNLACGADGWQQMTSNFLQVGKAFVCQPILYLMPAPAAWAAKRRSRCLV
jgi:hypothetical protein